MTLSITTRVHALQEQVRPYSPVIIAVTKYAALDQMREVRAAGIRDFGENKVQDALQKQSLFLEQTVESLGEPLQWHFIGRLQSNKVKKLIGKFSLIHSVDSIALAQEISHFQTLSGLSSIQPILLQVNVSGEATKQGFRPDEAIGAVRAISALSGVKIRGLMTIAPQVSRQPHGENNPDALISSGLSDKRASMQYFSILRACRDEMEKKLGQEFPELSMGMTQDYMQALACGATMIRIGSYLFDPQSRQAG